MRRSLAFLGLTVLLLTGCARERGVVQPTVHPAAAPEPAEGLAQAAFLDTLQART